MKIYSETSLWNFNFWSGAVNTARMLTIDEFNELEAFLEADNPDGMSDVEINDLFWFETDFIAEFLGYEDYEQMYNDRCDRIY